MASEAEHNLILGICERLINRPDQYAGRPYLVTAEDDGKVVLAGAMTPPFKLVLTRAAIPEALGAVAEDLMEAGLDPPGAGPFPEEAGGPGLERA